MTENSQTHRLQFLDSIRGLAALSVLLHHSFVITLPPNVERWFQVPYLSAPFNGREAVAMFFVLSGFVLSRPYLHPTNAGGTAKKLFLPGFYLRRFTRIWLPWLCIFGLSAAAKIFLFHQWQTVPPIVGHHWEAPLTLKSFFKQCLFIDGRSNVELIPQDWSLGVELRASAIFPLYIFLCAIDSMAILLVLALAIFIFVPTGHYHVSIIMGVFMARWEPAIVDWLRAKSVQVKIGLLLLGGVFYDSFYLVEDVFKCEHWIRFSWLGTAFGCVLIIFACATSRRLQSILHFGPILALGRISYSFYLLQMIVLMCVLPAWNFFLNIIGIREFFWILPLDFFASITVTAILAFLSFHGLEQPCIRWGHALSQKWQARFSRN